MRIGALLDCFTPQECANYTSQMPDTLQHEAIMLEALSTAYTCRHLAQAGFDVELCRRCNLHTKSDQVNGRARPDRSLRTRGWITSAWTIFDVSNGPRDASFSGCRVLLWRRVAAMPAPRYTGCSSYDHPGHSVICYSLPSVTAEATRMSARSREMAARWGNLAMFGVAGWVVNKYCRGVVASKDTARDELQANDDAS
jgi:hypothetical protein